jgi:hypothetical protein
MDLFAGKNVLMASYWTSLRRLRRIATYKYENFASSSCLTYSQVRNSF